MSLIDYVPQVIDWAKQSPLVTMLEVANFSWNNIEFHDIVSYILTYTKYMCCILMLILNTFFEADVSSL